MAVDKEEEKELLASKTSRKINKLMKEYGFKRVKGSFKKDIVFFLKNNYKNVSEEEKMELLVEKLFIKEGKIVINDLEMFVEKMKLDERWVKLPLWLKNVMKLECDYETEKLTCARELTYDSITRTHIGAENDHTFYEILRIEERRTEDKLKEMFVKKNENKIKQLVEIANDLTKEFEASTEYDVFVGKIKTLLEDIIKQ